MQRESTDKVILVTVGLPASGKSYLSQKVSRYINWLGYEAEVFSVQDYRRKNIAGVNADFLNPYNKVSTEIRTKCFE